MTAPSEGAARAASPGVTGAPAAVDLTVASRALHPWPLRSAPVRVAPRPGAAARTGTPAPATHPLVVIGDRVDESVDLAEVARVPGAFAPHATTRAGDQDAPAAAVEEVVAAASALDAIDQAFIDFRLAVRTNFTAFANQLGYLGKQLYIAFNFAESIVASVIFNGTDILRGEGLLTNVGDIGRDLVESVVFFAIDQIALTQPEVNPLPISRPPLDRPAGWVDALPPHPTLPLAVPGQAPAQRSSGALTVEDAEADTDALAGADDTAERSARRSSEADPADSPDIDDADVEAALEEAVSDEAAVEEKDAEESTSEQAATDSEQTEARAEKEVPSTPATQDSDTGESDE